MESAEARIQDSYAVHKVYQCWNDWTFFDFRGNTVDHTRFVWISSYLPQLSLLSLVKRIIFEQ